MDGELSTIARKPARPTVYREIHPNPEDEFHSEDRYRRQLANHMSVPGKLSVISPR